MIVDGGLPPLLTFAPRSGGGLGSRERTRPFVFRLPEIVHSVLSALIRTDRKNERLHSDWPRVIVPLFLSFRA